MEHGDILIVDVMHVSYKWPKCSSYEFAYENSGSYLSCLVCVMLWSHSLHMHFKHGHGTVKPAQTTPRAMISKLY